MNIWLEVLKAVDRLPRAIELVARVWWQERGSDSDNLDMTSLVEKLRADRDLVMTDPDYPDEVKSVSVGVKYAYMTGYWNAARRRRDCGLTCRCFPAA
ncbi:MAG: hypothetical protein U0X75_19280 [Acidobacteriota bacterium]